MLAAPIRQHDIANMKNDIDASIIAEAADWLVLLQSGDLADADQRAFNRWQNQTPAHSAAWARAQAMLGTFANVPGQIGRPTLRQAATPARRRNMQVLGMLLVSGPVVWAVSNTLPWQAWSADYATTKGEQRTIDLADGTRLVLNTSSSVDVRFTATERHVTLLSGEILITTGQDTTPTYRPFIVTTAQGAMRALGTQFTVRRLQDDVFTRLDVFEGAVEVTPGKTSHQHVVHAGEQLTFGATQINDIQAADSSSVLWSEGMILARDMPLGQLIRELARYRTGILRCDPAVADIIVSGAFPLKDTNASLDLLRKTLPVSIRSVTDYWVTISAAS